MKHVDTICLCYISLVSRPRERRDSPPTRAWIRGYCCMYSVQYSYKLMQRNACSKLYKIYWKLMLQLTVLLFFQPQNTANWDAGSYITKECSTHFIRSIYYCTKKMSYYSCEMMTLYALFQCHYVVHIADWVGKGKEKTAETMSRDIASHSVGNTRQVQHAATCLYYLSIQLHLAVLSTMDSSNYNRMILHPYIWPGPCRLSWIFAWKTASSFVYRMSHDHNNLRILEVLWTKCIPIWERVA